MGIVIVGAGLAGLRAAGALARSRDVVVLEASDAIGGRVATDRVDGFLVDRGFQLLNPAYPAARRALDLRRLDLHRFGRGAALRTDDGLQILADPTRHPAQAPQLLSGALVPGDVAAIVRWARAAGEPGATFTDSLDRAGMSTLARRAVERFFAGVTLDATGSTSAAQVRRLAGYFALATPGIPAQGMAAIPAQLAEGLGDRIERETPVAAVHSHGGRLVVEQRDGRERPADAVVLAAGPVGNAALLGAEPPRMLGVTTWWFAAPTAPSASRFLHLDLRDGARIANACVQSNVSPSYAPVGRHLVQISALTGHGLGDDAARQAAGEMFGASPDGWELLARHDIAQALPSMTPGVGGPGPAPDGVVVADDLPGASIQAALSAGERAASGLGRP